MNFIEVLRWRGLLFDSTPGTEAHLQEGIRTGYVGFDPSAPSLHIGNLVQIMLLVHLQRSGHQPIALVGGATGMIGDPSGKSEERKLLDEQTIRAYEVKIKDQLSKFLDFGSGKHAALLENNYEWFKDIKVLDFLREVGKHISVNYMMAKDSVKNRLDGGISFTEFTYQLMQGFDFIQLSEKRNCTLQMGGSDQWGNITTGIELARRKGAKELFAVTSPLITRADGKKLGKTEEGTVWLDAAMTSPYKFYQYWLNTADADAGKYLRYFTLMEKEEIEAIETQHAAAPHLRLLQQALGKEITARVHSVQDYEAAVRASQILFGQATKDELLALSNREIEEIFEGVPSLSINRSLLDGGIEAIPLLADITHFFSSRGEARKLIEARGVSVNKQVIDGSYKATAAGLINNRYLLLQKGKKNYFLLIVA